MALAVTWRIPVNGTTYQYPVPRLLRAFLAQNLSSANLIIDTQTGDPYPAIPSGQSQKIMPTQAIAVIQAHTDAAATGEAWIFGYDSPEDLSSNATLGAQQVFITNATIAVNGTVTATISGNVNIGNTVTVTGNVNATITNTVNVNITGTVTIPISGAVTISSGSVTATISGAVTITSGTVNIGNVPGVIINNSGPITTIDPNRITTLVQPNNTQVNVTTTRQTSQYIVQPLLSTLLRDGLLSIYATDPSGNQYNLCIQDEIQVSGVSIVLLQCFPYIANVALPSGSVIGVRFTGQMNLAVIY